MPNIREYSAPEGLGLRKEAQDEIDRLLAFLDETDGYSTTEQEEAADDVPCDDDEIDGGDGMGRQEDDEPSLGWTSGEAARGRCYAGAYGAGVDTEDDAGDSAEHDPAEAGIVDMDGLMEQLGRRFNYREVL